VGQRHPGLAELDFSSWLDGERIERAQVYAAEVEPNLGVEAEELV
jgi:hypothetical protein